MFYSSDVLDGFLQSICKLYDKKKSSYKYCNKQYTTRDDGNVQSHGQEENKLNSSIKVNSGAHARTHDEIIKSIQ